MRPLGLQHFGGWPLGWLEPQAHTLVLYTLPLISVPGSVSWFLSLKGTHCDRNRMEETWFTQALSH